jgi:hypothetical protein
MSTSNTSNSAKDHNDSSKQATLLDTHEYQHETTDGIPEDIQRDFNIPTEASIRLLDRPTSKIKELLKPDRIKAATVFETKDSPIWRGCIDTQLFNTVIKTLLPTIKKGKIGITENGWLLRLVDHKNVILYHIWIDSSDFESYDLTAEGIIAVDFTEIKSTLKHIKQSNLKLGVTDDDLQLTTDTTTTLKSLDPDSIRRVSNIPNIDTTESITLTGVELKDIISRFNAFDGNTQIRTNNRKSSFTFASRNEGEDVEMVKSYQAPRDIQTTSHRTANKIFDMNINNNTDTRYNTQLLNDFISTIPKSTLNSAYTLHTGDELPLKIETSLADQSKIETILAPKIKKNK